MKIIKEGSIRKVNNIKLFACKECGCEFEADKNEYERCQQRNEIYYCCKCPFCNIVAYTDGK